jgi:cytosine/adenosine deaminase-related metal-dependent hydrolase
MPSFNALLLSSRQSGVLVLVLLGLSACGGPDDPSRFNGDDVDAGSDAFDNGDIARDSESPSDTDFPDANDAGGFDANDASRSDVAPDGGADGGADGGPRDIIELDGGPAPDAADALTDAGSDTSDGSTRPDVDIVPTDGPFIEVPGTGGVILRGVVLTPDGVLDPGEVFFAEGTIICVDTDCSGSAGAGDATIVNTRGTISPGLIDAHNHLAYNFLPEWNPPEGRLYENRYQWADEPSYEEWVLPYTANRSSNSHFCPGAQWGELRSILHGTTTMQGQSFERTCTVGMARNADHRHDLGDDHMQTTISSVRDINDDAAAGYNENFESGEITRFAVHMQEGYAADNVLLELESFAGRDTRNNRHMGLSLLNDTSILIHSISLTNEQLDEVEETGAHIVWSPSSNIVLYGQTLRLDEVLARDITVGLGPDWTLSGEDDMLGEMAYALAYAQAEGLALSTERLWRMATIDGAEVVGLGDRTGRLEAGYAADIMVVAADSDDPYLTIIEARAQDVAGVWVNGEVVYGVPALDGLTTACETLTVCGDARFVCRPADSTYPTVGDIEQTLLNILMGTGYADDEQYGRTDLLPLVDCAR